MEPYGVVVSIHPPLLADATKHEHKKEIQAG